jgi:hypothetical protein
MLRRLFRVVVTLWIVASFSMTGGINWKTVWLEPNPVGLPSPGSSISYIVKGIDGANNLADLTRNRYLSVTSSDQNIISIDQANATITGKAVGHVEIRISFSECTSIIQAWVRDPSKEQK